MSFATEQKSDIVTMIKKSACCRRSLLLGALSTRATAFGDIVSVGVTGDEIIEFLSAYILEFYGICSPT